jgi:predicted nucleotidyltransferase
MQSLHSQFSATYSNLKNTIFADIDSLGMKNKDKIITIIKDRIHESLPDAEVLLFGSHARKNATLESDYDILLIISTELSPKEKLPGHIIQNILREAILL